jgi:hypothetical protein
VSHVNTQALLPGGDVKHIENQISQSVSALRSQTADCYFTVASTANLYWGRTADLQQA